MSKTLQYRRYYGVLTDAFDGGGRPTSMEHVYTIVIIGTRQRLHEAVHVHNLLSEPLS